jgi:hypothetical protein
MTVITTRLHLPTEVTEDETLLSDQFVQAYHASVDITIERKPGFLTFFSIDGQPYRLQARCECPAEVCRLYSTPRASDKPGERTMTLECATHGITKHLATLERKETYNKSIYAWVEERHAKDKRVQWGMSRRKL